MLRFKLNNLTYNAISRKAYELEPLNKHKAIESGTYASVILPMSQVSFDYVNGDKIMTIPKWLYDKSIAGKKNIESRLTAI